MTTPTPAHVFYNHGRWWIAALHGGPLLAGPLRARGEAAAKDEAVSMGYSVAHTGMGTRDDLMSEMMNRAAFLRCPAHGYLNMRHDDTCARCGYNGWTLAA